MCRFYRHARSILVSGFGVLALATATAAWAIDGGRVVTPDEVVATPDAPAASSDESAAATPKATPKESPAAEAPKDSTAAAEEAELKPHAESENDLEDIETIVTTVRRRSELLEQTPVSASVLSGSMLEDRGIDSLEQVGVYIPNLSTFQGTQRAGTFYSRGVGQRDAIVTVDPGVGIYVDDVYVSRGHGALLPTLDLERVEMLRGPQGTLYGKNTIGGALKLVTEKPGPSPMVSATVGGGSFDDYRTSSTFNVPIVDDMLYSRFSFASNNNQGYTRNMVDDNHYNDDNLLGTRGQFRLLPQKYVTVDFAGQFSNEKEDVRGGKCRVSDPTLASLIPGLSQACQRADDSSTYDFASNYDNKYRLMTYGTSMTADWDIGSALDKGPIDLKSISSWQQQRVDEGTVDLDYTAVPYISMQNVNPLKQRQVSQELQGNAAAFDGKVKLTSGVYGLWEQAHGGDQRVFGFGGAYNRQDRVDVDNASYAFYSQSSYTPFSWVEMTGGVRYTREFKTAHRFIDTGASPGEDPNEHASDDFGAWTPMATIAFHAPQSLIEDTFVDNGIVYFSYSEGYKSGGFSTRRDPSLLKVGEFNPEKLDNFEVGMKVDLFDNHLQLNTSAFYAFYQDIQLNVSRVNPASLPFQPDTGATMSNAGKAHIRGLELEGIAQVEKLRLRASLGLTDAKYDQFEDQTWDINPGTGLVENIRKVGRSNEDFIFTPLMNFDATLEYGFDTRNFGLPRAGTLTPLVHVYYQDSTHAQLSPQGWASNQFRQGPYSLLDLRLIYDLPDDRTQMAFFVNNVTGTEYFDGAVDATSAMGIGGVYMGAPRTIGGQIRYRFDAPSWSEL